jgi:hypothetical protein
VELVGLPLMAALPLTVEEAVVEKVGRPLTAAPLLTVEEAVGPIRLRSEHL